MNLLLRHACKPREHLQYIETTATRSINKWKSSDIGKDEICIVVVNNKSMAFHHIITQWATVWRSAFWL